MSYSDKCNLLNRNPVIVARHFQYRVELSFRVIVLDGLLGKTNYHAIRVEFQLRGSPHVYSFIWILNVPYPVITIPYNPYWMVFLELIFQMQIKSQNYLI